MTSYHDDPNKLPPADEDVRLVLDSFNRSKEELVTETQKDKWKAADKIYRAIVEEDATEVDDTTITDFVVPLVFWHVESFHPRLMASNPRIEVWGRGQEDGTRAAQHRAMLFYYWDRLNLPLFLVDVSKMGLIRGTAWAKVYWKREERKRKSIRFAPPSFFGAVIPGVPPRREEVERMEVVYDLPQADLIDNDQVFPDPDGMDEDTCAWIIHRRQATLREIEAAGDLYKPGPVSQLREKVKLANTKQDQFDSLQQEMAGEVGGEAMIQPDIHKRQIHLLEFWDDERVITIVEEHQDIPPLRKEFHGIGMKPFLRYTPIRVPLKIMGIGLPEILYSVNEELNTIHQARADNVKQLVHKMMTVRRTSQIQPGQLVRRSGGWIDVIDHDDIAVLDTGDVNFSAYREADALQMFAQRISGANDITQGVGGRGAGNTATQAQLLAESSASRSTLMFKILSEMFLKRLGRLLVRLTDLHMTTPKMVRVAGSEFEGTEFQLPGGDAGSGFVEVTPEGLNSGSDVDLDLLFSVAETDPEVRRARQSTAVNMLQVLGQLLPPNHPVLEFYMGRILEGEGLDRPQLLLQQGRPLLDQWLAQQQAQQAPQSGVQTPGDELAFAQSLAAPPGGRQVPS